MKLAIARLLVTSALLVACSDGNADNTPQDQAASTPAATARAVTGENTPVAAPGAVVALGLTADQLGDADVLNASGVEIAEVERVITDASGAVTGLLVEIEDTDPDRYVTIPLDGLTVVQHGDDQDLRSNLTREQLLALPATPR